MNSGPSILFKLTKESPDQGLKTTIPQQSNTYKFSDPNVEAAFFMPRKSLQLLLLVASDLTKYTLSFPQHLAQGPQTLPHQPTNPPSHICLTSPKLGFLNLLTLQASNSLLCGLSCVHCRMFMSIPGLHPVDASSTPSPLSPEL